MNQHHILYIILLYFFIYHRDNAIIEKQKEGKSRKTRPSLGEA